MNRQKKRRTPEATDVESGPSLNRWELKKNRGTSLERELASTLVGSALSGSDRDRGLDTLTASVDVGPLIFKLSPDSGVWLDGVWHITRAEPAAVSLEAEVLPNALRLIRDGGLAAEAELSIQPYTAKTVQSERLGRVFKIVTTAHHFSVTVTIGEAAV